MMSSRGGRKRKSLITDTFKMKKSKPNSKSRESIAPVNASSPVHQNKKHQITPLKVKSKLSKSRNDRDVHNSCTSPVTPKSRLSKSRITSPVGQSLAAAYYLGGCSQELPEVIWDYNSPKNKRGRHRNFRAMTIGDLLTNMNKNNQQECDDDPCPSSHLNLLEKWMEFRNLSPAAHKSLQKTYRRAMRKPSEHVMEKMQILLQSLAEEDVFKNGTEDDSKDTVSSKKETFFLEVDNILKQELMNAENILPKDDIDNNDADTDDEMWGEGAESDDSLIVKATQEFESCLISPLRALKRSPLSQGNICSFIPETAVNSRINTVAFKCPPLLPPKPPEIPDNALCNHVNSITKPSVVPHASGNTLSFVQTDGSKDGVKGSENTLELTECEWDSELDGWEEELFCESAFAIENTEDPVAGETNSSSELCLNGKVLGQSHAEDVAKHQLSSGNKTEQSGSVQISKDQSECLSGPVLPTVDAANQSCVVSSDDFSLNENVKNEKKCIDEGSDFLVDESLFNESEILTWWDNDESMSSTSPKCCDEEIALKRQAALQKLRQKQKNKYHKILC